MVIKSSINKSNNNFCLFQPPGYSLQAWQGTSGEEEPPDFVGNRWQVPLGHPDIAALFSGSGSQ